MNSQKKKDFCIFWNIDHHPLEFYKHVVKSKMQENNFFFLCLWHYQKFAKYQRIYRQNISVGNLRSELPTERFRP